MYLCFQDEAKKRLRGSRWLIYISYVFSSGGQNMSALIFMRSIFYFSKFKIFISNRIQVKLKFFNTLDLKSDQVFHMLSSGLRINFLQLFKVLKMSGKWAKNERAHILPTTAYNSKNIKNSNCFMCRNTFFPFSHADDKLTY